MSLTQSQNYNDDPNHFNPMEGGHTQQPMLVQTPQMRTRAYNPSSKIKWRDIMKIDLEMIARTNDLSVLEFYLENMVYSDITEDEIQSVPEGNIVKLIKVCQFTIEYLLSTQQKLETNCRNLETHNSQLNIDLINKDQQLKDNKDIIRTLKKEKKHNETVLLTYKNVIDNRHYKRANKQSVNNSQSESLNESKQRYYCKYCKGKKYSTEELLNTHLHKRHLIDLPSAKEEPRGGQLNDGSQLMGFEKKLEDMKTHLEGYFKKFQEENSLKNLENQRKFDEDKQSKHLEDMGHSFKNTLIELKDFYLQNTIKHQQQQLQHPIQISSIPVAPSQEQVPMNNANEQMTMMLKEELTKLNEGLLSISSRQDQKLNSLSEKLNTLKKSEPHREQVYQKEIRSEKEKELEKEEPILKIVPQHATTYVKSVQNKKIEKRKAQFNAGPIESDNDDSDDDKKKKKKKNKKAQNIEDVELIAGLKNATSYYNEFVNKGKLQQSYREPTKEIQLSVESKRPKDNAPKKKSESPKSVKKQESLHYIDPKESFGVTAKTQIIKSDLLEEFNAFEEKYNKRDQELIQQNQEENYLVNTLPQKFNMSQNVLSTTLKKCFFQTTKKNTLNEQLDYEEIEKETKDGILHIIDKTLKNINQLNSKNKEIGEYYQSLQQFLDLKLYENDKKDFGEETKPKKSEQKKIEYLKEKHDDVISEANNINSKTNPIISAKKKREDNDLEEMDLEQFDS